MTGVFITLEGGEGSGKSTFSQALKLALQERGLSVLTTREPGGSEGAELIRSLLVTGPTDRWDGFSEYLLLSAARRDHIVKTIFPALKAGTWVICDRFFDSSLAYQGVGQGLDKDMLKSIYGWIAKDLQPYKTFLLDIDPNIGLQRTRGQDRNLTEVRYEALDLAFHQKVRQGFLDLAAQEPERFCCMDATHSTQQLVTWALEALSSKV